MVNINPALVPSVAPGNLFTSLTQNESYNIRWLYPTDPVFYETLNRPMADITLRQLILAKSLDLLSLSVGHQAMFPFLVQAEVANGTTSVDVPPGWIWDLHMSTPNKWQDFRLAKIKRMSGGTGTGEEEGTLRLIFTANQQGSSVEVSLFYADYLIDSSLTYQRARLTVVDSSEESIVIDQGEAGTIGGFVTFRTLDRTDAIVDAFYTLLEPPTDTTDSNGDGFYDNPAVYDIVSTPAGGAGVTSDFSYSGMTHGTGLLVDSTNNTIPQLDSDVQSWITTFNYPFDIEANRTSTTTASVQIPIGLFREFDITAPAGDEPTGDTTGTFFPVWVSRIAQVGSGNQLRFYFATHNVTDTSPSLDAIEFARLDLQDDMIPGQIVEIAPIDDLKLNISSDDELYQQHFGRGHVVLSTEWSGTSSVIEDFFAAFDTLIDNEAEFTQSSTRLSSYGVSRVPKYVPTIGQNQALEGTTSLFDQPIPPSSENLYITEQDQGLGNRVDLESSTDITPHEAISRFANIGSLAHRIFQLCIDNTKVPTGTETGAGVFYEEEVLPRMRQLLGRDPQFGDFWHDGTNLFFFNGDTWQS